MACAKLFLVVFIAVVSTGHYTKLRKVSWPILSEREMNPLTLLCSVAALTADSPAMPMSPSDSMHVPPPSVLNDSVAKWDSTGWSGRVVVGEYMTGIHCGVCQPHTYAFDSLIARYPYTVFIPLAYHIDGDVPIANPESNIRDNVWHWYDMGHIMGHGKVITAVFADSDSSGSFWWDDWVDGHASRSQDKMSASSIFRSMVKEIDAELHKAPEAVLHLEAKPRGGTIVAKLQVESLSPGHPDVYVRMVVVEDTVILKVTDTSLFNKRPLNARRLNWYMASRAELHDVKEPAEYTLGIPLHGTGTITYTFDMAKTQKDRLRARNLHLGKVQPMNEKERDAKAFEEIEPVAAFGGLEGWTMNPTRLHVVAFVQDAHTGDVLQAQMVHVNTGPHGELLKLPL